MSKKRWNYRSSRQFICEEKVCLMQNRSFRLVEGSRELWCLDVP